MTGRAFTFVGGSAGRWRVERAETISGDPLAAAAHVDVVDSLLGNPPPGASWMLRGVTSHERYVTRAERELLVAQQPGLGRPAATCAALIPVRKSAAWWALAQDERRALLEDRSKHIEIGREYLPAVARRLHHSRDLGEPFDFLTWFEFAPEHEPRFDHLLARLRASEEWTFVQREVDLRLVRAADA
jgi:hypothetical protein